MVTDPTWKDPLLQRWVAGFDDVNLGLFLNLANAAPYAPPRDSGPLRVLEWVGQFSSYRADAARLRSLIDAELARGREAVEVLRENEWASSAYPEGRPACPVCGEWEPIQEGKVGHATDCRLAKVIGGG